MSLPTSTFNIVYSRHSRITWPVYVDWNLMYHEESNNSIRSNLIFILVRVCSIEFSIFIVCLVLTPCKIFYNPEKVVFTITIIIFSLLLGFIESHFLLFSIYFLISSYISYIFLISSYGLISSYFSLFLIVSTIRT